MGRPAPGLSLLNTPRFNSSVKTGPSAWRSFSRADCCKLKAQAEGYGSGSVTKKTAGIPVFTHFDSAEDPVNAYCAEGKPSSLVGFLGY
jgi:hypothetical protein